MRTIGVKVYEVVKDGLPDPADLTLVGRVAFVVGGCIISGTALQHVWEEHDGYPSFWKVDTDLMPNEQLGGITHWLEFPVAVWELGRKAE